MVVSQMDQGFLAATKVQTAATLAAGIIAASGRPHSIAEALALKDDIYWALYPEQDSGRYEEWAKRPKMCD